MSQTESGSAAAPEKKRARDTSLDIFRGLAILEVVIHHTSSFALIRTGLGTISHDAYVVLNRTLHFAVPAFLFIMGVLLTRTMLGKGKSWKDFFTRRAQQTLWPYVVWTALYGAYRVLVGRNDLQWHNLLEPERIFHWLLWGKAWDHLYFLSLALQLYLVFPLLMRLFMRIRIGLAPVLVLTLAAQAAIHYFHGRELWPGMTFRLPYPGTALIWHLIPVVTGAWVGVHLDEWPTLWNRWLKRVAVLMMVGGWTFYLPESYKELHHVRVHSELLHYSYWAFTLGTSFCLLTFCRYIARTMPRLGGALQWMGTQSMQVYLVHPMVLYLWASATFSGSTTRFHFTVMLVAASAFGISLLISQLAERLHLSMLLFGRPAPALKRLN
ncbi:MAG: acyltransferase [Armatimonadota bacterium]